MLSMCKIILQELAGVDSNVQRGSIKWPGPTRALQKQSVLARALL